MKRQEVETSLDFKKTVLTTKTKSKRLATKFKEWFWDFLERSE
jgi:hypothetical protein